MPRFIAIHGKARSGKNEIANILCLTYGFKQASFAKKVKEFGIKYFELNPEETETKTKEARRILQGIGSSVRNYAVKVSNSLDSPSTTPLGVSGFPIWVEEIGEKEFKLEPVYFSKKNRKKTQKFLAAIYRLFTENIQAFRDRFSIIENTLEKSSLDIWINFLIEECVDDSVYIIPDLRFKNEKNFIKNTGGKIIKVVRVDKPNIEFGETHSSEVELDLETDWDYVIINEHKADWQNRLEQSISNAIRKFDSVEFFTTKDKEQFNIPIINISQKE